jgi:hypothetical protein
VSTAVVSTALAAGLCIRLPLTFRSRGGFAGSDPAEPSRWIRKSGLSCRSVFQGTCERTIVRQVDLDVVV